MKKFKSEMLKKNDLDEEKDLNLDRSMIQRTIIVLKILNGAQNFNLVVLKLRKKCLHDVV